MVVGPAEKEKPVHSLETRKPEDEQDDEEVTPKPPDGGWGWVVVFSSFMIHVIADGVVYTFGIFYMEFLKYYEESKGMTAWVASIMVGTTFCVGPIASGLTNKYGCRTVSIIGALVASAGLILSLAAPSVVYLFFTIGLCTGVGFGLMYLPAIVSVSCYFEKKRAFATGIAVCGSGFGTFAMAPLTEMLVEEYGWRGAMLIIAGLMLNCCVFGALFRPLEAPCKEGKKGKVHCNKRNSSDQNREATKEERETMLCNGSTNRVSQNPNANGRIANGPQELNTLAKTDNANSHTKHHHHHLERKSEERFNKPDDTMLNVTDQRLISSAVSLHSISSNTPRRSNCSVQLGNSGQQAVLYRKDIFYSGSLLNIPQYRSNPALYSLSVTSLPRTSVDFTNKSRKKIMKLCSCSEEIKDAFREMMDMRLLRDLIFLLFAISNFFTSIGFNVPYLYTKDRAVGLKIANEEQASMLLSIIGISNTVGRVVLGYMSDRKWVNRLWLYNGCLATCGLATAFSSFCKDYFLMGGYATVFGVTAGAYVSLTSVILVDLLGLEKLTNAFGLLLLFEGVACFIGPPITGWLYDATGSYDLGFYVSGGMIAFSGIMLFAIPCLDRYQKGENTTCKLVVTTTVPATSETDCEDAEATIALASKDTTVAIV